MYSKDQEDKLYNLTTAKNLAIHNLNIALRNSTPRNQIRMLADKTAQSEGDLAAFYEELGEINKALINYSNQASCLIQAGKTGKAIDIYEKVIVLSRASKFRNWVRKELKQLKQLKN